MKRGTSIKLKAAFLLVVFSLNTVVGFACSVGVDMGFNTKHHDDTEAVVHIHKDGKRHIHYEKKEKHDHSKSHQHGKSHHHDQESNLQSKDSKDNCCSDKVKDFAEIDKAIPNAGKANSHPLFAIAFLASFYSINIFARSQSAPDIKQFVRCYHPPISDIRIAIKSFQI